MPKTLLQIFFPEDYMPELTLESLKVFLKSLPTAQKIEKEAGLQQGYLGKIMAGDRSLTEKTKAKLLPVLQKYNFKH